MVAGIIDPRRLRAEDPQPAYRVDHRDECGASDEWCLAGADDVHEVLRRAQAADRAASLCAGFVYAEHGKRTVFPIRLAGISAW